MASLFFLEIAEIHIYVFYFNIIIGIFHKSMQRQLSLNEINLANKFSGIQNQP